MYKHVNYYIYNNFWQSAFIILYLTSLSEPTLTINPYGSAAEMGSLNCDIQTPLYVIGRTSKFFFIIDNAYYGLLCLNPVKHHKIGGQREMMNNCTERLLHFYYSTSYVTRYNA